MKMSGIGLATFLTCSVLFGTAKADVVPRVQAATAQDQELIDLSQQKWQWMADRNVDALSGLFNDKAIFVHMSRTMSKPQELEVISSGNIQYARADVHEISVQIIGDTAIVASRIDLHAIVGGNIADNPFSVTETYVRMGGKWSLGALVFSKRSVPN